MIWKDTALPKILGRDTPTMEELRENPVQFGRYSATLTPNQWELLFARETFLFWVGGVRSSKSWGGVFRGLSETLFIPDNKGIVGRLTQTDLQDTAQRDFYEIADATGLVKHKNDRKMTMYCCDTEGRVLPSKVTSEILFLHFDNPNHLKGHGIGWFWMDEGSECADKSYFRLVDRLSHPAAKGKYLGVVTSNPEGRNWIWKHAYDEMTVMARDMAARLKHRAIHNRTKDNPFLSEEYLRNLYATAPPDWIRRYADGEFDVFEGQIFKEFSTDVHCVRANECTGWVTINGRRQPPTAWPRLMGIDCGGTDPWAFEIAAIDPWGNIVFYDEIYRPEVYVGNFKADLDPKMRDVKFAKIPMDYENKVAMEELKRLGVKVTNAIKRQKGKISLNKTARYLHPNPDRGFPSWHPRAGTNGSPGMFFTDGCPKLVEEIPQQRWRELRGHDGITLNEPDPNVANHACDAMFYLVRECREPELLEKSKIDKILTSEIDLRSKMYWLKVEEHQEDVRRQARHGRGILPPSPRQRVTVN